MDLGGWIDLHAFSKKYGVSLSTLRRRIRANSIEFKLEKGRYWLPDQIETMGAAPLFSRNKENAVPRQSIKAAVSVEHVSRLQELESENRRLKAQIAELETLVGVLESELQRESHVTADLG
jgi:hypothetical protein